MDWESRLAILEVSPAQLLMLRLLFVSYRYTRDTSYHSIIYRHSDINREALQGARCGVSDSSFPEHAKRATTTVETVREKRQSPRNRTRVRCDFNITGDYKFFKEVTKNVAGSKEVQERVATSLLVSYVQGASRIFQVPRPHVM